MDVSKQAVGQALADLAYRRLVELVPDPADGRARLVRLTETGAAAYDHGRGVAARNRAASSIRGVERCSPPAMIAVGYTRIVSCTLRRIACLVLLSVLSGAPAVAVICAELCAPAAHQAEARHDGLSCHGRTVDGPSLTGQGKPDCGDHAATNPGALASLATSRSSHLAVMHPVEATRILTVIAGPSSHLVLAVAERMAPPPGPAPSTLVLRI